MSTTSRSQRVDAVLRWLHRWVGLTLGVPFVIVCLSGTLLLFQPQYFSWAHGELIPDDMSSEIGSIDAWVANAREAVPALGDPVAIWAPHVEHNVSDAGMLVFGGLEPGGLGNMGFAAVLVAPATGKVLGVVDIDRSPAYAPLFLHRDFWTGELGRFFLGLVAVTFLPILIAGAYLWWPAQGRMRGKLSPLPWRRTFTRARPLHDWTGIWILPLLLVLTATGMYLVQPGWVEPILAVVPDEYRGVAGDEIATASAFAASNDTNACAPIGFDTAIARARALVPSGDLAAIYPAEAAWELVFKPDEKEAMFHETHVLARLACGYLTVEATPSSRSLRETTEMWFISLHDGTAAGMTGRLLVTASGVIPLVLLWSGVRMWSRTRALAARKRGASKSGAEASGRR